MNEMNRMNKVVRSEQNGLNGWKSACYFKNLSVSLHRKLLRHNPNENIFKEQIIIKIILKYFIMKHFLSIIFLLASLTASANLEFSFNEWNMTCSVRAGYYIDVPYPYVNGDEYIPSTCVYNGLTYTVTEIADRAFYNCGYYYYQNAIESWSLDGLTGIDIPETITRIGSSAFYGCNSLKTVNIHNLEAWCNIDFDGSPLSYASEFKIIAVR